MTRSFVSVALGAALSLAAASCGRGEAAPPPRVEAAAPPSGAPVAAVLPRAPGAFAPSLLEVHGAAPPAGEPSLGQELSDADSCATCHPDAAAQWAQSAHSFASFGNPIYRANVELLRRQLGEPASRHCGGCHDLPLLVDGLMVGAQIPAADLRSHSGVTCRLCHGVSGVTVDGNGSYRWSTAPLDAPALDNPAEIAAHKAAVSVGKLGSELCVSCHRGFLSPDLGVPVHLLGIDEPTAWRSSAWTGNGMARVDKVEPKTCIDCHMEREPASSLELGAKGGKLASHRFVGGHTWMASMRGDADQLRRTAAKLEGAATVDVAGVRYADGRWALPADGAALPAQGATISIDVVLRNALVGHRFPGGVLDMQDTWLEVDVTDRQGASLASSGGAHERDPDDLEAHVLRSLVVDEQGQLREKHELATFRAVLANHTLAAREAQAVRYELTIPALTAERLPLTVTARLRHRSRSLREQAEVCEVARTRQGKAFLRGAVGARDVHLDPCAPQPITLIAQASAQLGAGAAAGSPRPAWARLYEHGMGLTSVISERLEEPRQVLEAAYQRARALGCASEALSEAQGGAREAPRQGPGDPACRAEAMILTQLAVVAGRQGRTDDALRLLARAQARLTAPYPAALDAVAADALGRVWRWREAAPYARRAAEAAPGNTSAWTALAKVLASAGDDRGALAAAQRGLALAPRDSDLLRSQATALAALGSPQAAAALAAFDRFRAPDQAAELRITCARGSKRCGREREQIHRHELAPAGGRAGGKKGEKR
ncbi:MAG: multiheme c-type cytochrome [Kofleriaceae bacterium]